MNRHRPVLPRRCLAALATVLTLLPGLAACGGGEEEKEKREYAVPQDLCGMPIDVKALTPFFPPGKKVTLRPTAVKSEKQCAVNVDGRLALTIAHTWWDAGVSTRDYVLGRAKLPEHETADGRYFYSGSQGFGKTRGCVDDRSEEELYTAVQAFSSSHDDADAMKRIIMDFTENVQNSAACDQGPSETDTRS